MIVTARAATATRSPGYDPAATPIPGATLPKSTRAFLEQLVQVQLIDALSVPPFLQQYRDRLNDLANIEVLSDALLHSRLLTSYQLNRVRAGTIHGLVLGNYRVRDRLGSGAVGVVFLGEHVFLRRQVAIKVVPVDDHFPPAILERFYGEMRALAELNHPHIVKAYDAGRLPAPNPQAPSLHYLVMELLSGGDLEQHVYNNGPVTVARGCEWGRQAASGLQAAHDRNLIHRDLKPSNLLLAGDDRVKLVDFGLARQFSSNRTDPRSLLGSLDFMAPEQSVDPSAVNTTADIFSLGATLFWLLTGQTPYPAEPSIAKALFALQHDRPRRLREFLPSAPLELDDLIDRMLAHAPGARPATPLIVMESLTRFATAPAAIAITSHETAIEGIADERILVCGNHRPLRAQIRQTLATVGYTCDESGGAQESWSALTERNPDLVVIDLEGDTPGFFELCQRVRSAPPRPNMKLIVHGAGCADACAEAILQGADEFLPHPLDLTTLAAKVQHALQIKAGQDRATQAIQNLQRLNEQLQESLAARSNAVRRSHDALLFAMAKLAESRDGETAGHLRRLQQYAVCLAQHLKDDPGWAPILDATFLAQLERCTAVHDIGKLALPDSVLAKPGPLSADERLAMQQHTLYGCSILDAIAKDYGDSLDFLGMARTIVRHHHERHDGTGYPDKLKGDAIPHAARLVAIADVYDALRRKRYHKPALSHGRASETILREMAGAFDPAVLRAFAACHDRFQRIFLGVGS